MIKTRFAPSPTGYIHLGNARTALFSWLGARHFKGHFLLRIEDTDKERSTQAFTQSLLEDLTWMGCYWDEGPEKVGEFSPYFQSERETLYQEYYAKLEKSGRAYPCFCSETELAIHKKIQATRGLPPRYSGTCRALSAEQIAQKIEQGIKPALRFRVPDGELINFHDKVKGEQSYKTDDIGDFIIRRSEGSASFMFCNAIDDSLMQVTLVLRGDDHLTNTPRQIMILKALGMRTPEYGHLSLILGTDGSPLSKRNGSKSIRELREEGFFPEAVLNYLARLGHYFADNQGMSLSQLAEKFDTTHLSKSPAKFDEAQLLYWQKETLTRIPSELLWQAMGMRVHTLVPSAKKEKFIETIRHNIHFPKEALAWAELLYGDYTPIKADISVDFLKKVITVLEENNQVEGLLERIKIATGEKGKGLFHPIRIALTGRSDGPELAALFQLLGSEEIVSRFAKALHVHL